MYQLQGVMAASLEENIKGDDAVLYHDRQSEMEICQQSVLEFW